MGETPDPDRRRLLALALAAPIAFALGSSLGWRASAIAAASAGRAQPEPGRPRGAFPPTPECGDDDEPTPAETEGPFFKPRSPLRTSLLEEGLAGTTLVLNGRVFSRRCRPLSGALVDFWHADDEGAYDNEGFRLRGHQFTDAKGRYRLETIVPGQYPGRTRHIHVKLQAPHHPVLTTQLYFPGEPRNRTDRLFRPDLLMGITNSRDGQQARFHFVLDVA